MILYHSSPSDVIAGHLTGGFFEGWPNPPAPATHLRLLAGSDAVELAVDDTTGQVVGFVTAVTDGILCAYIPYLEVLPAYRRRGIGSELVCRILARFAHLYDIDLLCLPEVQPFYERLGFQRAHGMDIKNYQRQSGA